MSKANRPQGTEVGKWKPKRSRGRWRYLTRTQTGSGIIQTTRKKQRSTRHALSLAANDNTETERPKGGQVGKQLS
jgi:RNase P/RNase MRP subunit POP5